MKQTFIALFVAGLGFLPSKSFADYNPKTAASCIVYIQKVADSTSVPQFQIMCDAHQLLQQNIDFAALGDPKPLENALKQQLADTMGTDGVACTEYDSSEIWYQSCIRDSAFPKK